MKGLMSSAFFSYFMLALIVISIFFGVIFKVKHFNFTEIIKNYFDVFKDENEKTNILAIYLALVLPLWIALYVVSFSPDETRDYNTELLIVTILTALFFSVFGIIFSMKDKLKDSNFMSEKSASKKIRLNKLVDSVLYINLFEIVISVFILIFCFLSNLIDKVHIIFNIIIYYMLFVLLINMFILLKRLYVTLKEIIKD